MSSAVIDRAASLPTVAVENLKLPSVFLARKGERAGGRRGFELLPRTRLYAIIMHSSKHSPLGNIGAEQVLKALSPCWMLQVDLALPSSSISLIIKNVVLLPHKLPHRYQTYHPPSSLRARAGARKIVIWDRRTNKHKRPIRLPLRVPIFTARNPFL